MNDFKWEPDILYKKVKEVIPPKALSFKISNQTGLVTEIIKPRTHQFENRLREELQSLLKNKNSFPTKREVIVSIVHNINGTDTYLECDLDNRAKTILDALKNAVYKDDSQVKILWTHKTLLLNSQESFYILSVKILNKDISISLLKRMEDLILYN